jgi:hypothetical protein
MTPHENAPGEIVVLRPDHEEVLTAPSKAARKASRRARRARGGSAADIGTRAAGERTSAMAPTKPE